MSSCPVCAKKVVNPTGDKDSKILIIASVPGDDELNFAKPFVGFNGAIFKKELYKYAGIDLNATRQVYLWYHDKPSGKKGADCFAVSSDIVYKEMIGKTKIILIGADAVKHFTGLSVDDVNGFDVTSEADDKDGINSDMEFFALCNPNSVFQVLGELRFGLEKLKEWIQES